ncbi:MAG: VanZ family protein [Candidatus Rokubacteria bacterium]|nr:VanZ family protein [Candidatus Rokubacteria bacterium]
MSGTRSGRLPAGLELHPWYGLLTLTYVVGIYWLSSRPDLDPRQSDLWIQLAANLLHVPLYGGLTFCLLQAISGGRAGEEPSRDLSALALLATASYAALDEWHQSFVPGRSASVGDLFLDFVGIAGMLLVVRLSARNGRIGPGST